MCAAARTPVRLASNECVLRATKGALENRKQTQASVLRVTRGPPPARPTVTDSLLRAGYTNAWNQRSMFLLFR